MWQQSVKTRQLVARFMPFISVHTVYQLWTAPSLKHKNFQSVSFSLEEVYVFDEYVLMWNKGLVSLLLSLKNIAKGGCHPSTKPVE